MTDIIPITQQEYEKETGQLFINEESTDEFTPVSEEEACMVFGERIDILEHIPTFFKFSVDRENPLNFYKSDEHEHKRNAYVKIYVTLKGMSYLIAFKKEIEYNITMPNIEYGKCLKPITPSKFRKEFGYDMNVTSGECIVVPEATLYGLLYGAPDLSRYITESEVKSLMEYPIKTVHVYKPIVRGNKVIDRFLITNEVRRIVLGGYRELELK